MQCRRWRLTDCGLGGNIAGSWGSRERKVGAETGHSARTERTTKRKKQNSVEFHGLQRLGIRLFVPC